MNAQTFAFMAISGFCHCALAAPNSIVVTKSNAPMDGVNEIVPYSVSNHQIGPDDTIAFKAQFGPPYGYVWVIDAPDSTRTLIPGNSPLPGHAGLYSTREDLTLHDRTVISIGASSIPDSDRPEAWLVGTPEHLRVVAQQGSAVPGMSLGWVWNASNSFTVRIRSNGSAVVLGKTRGPNGEYGYAVIESFPDATSTLIAASGDSFVTPTGATSPISSVLDIAVSDAAIVLSVILQSPDLPRAVYLLESGVATPIVVGFQPVPEFGGIPMRNDPPKILKMTQNGQALIDVPVFANAANTSGLLVVGPGKSRRLVVEPDALFGVEGTRLRPDGGTMNNAGVVVFTAGIYTEPAVKVGEVAMQCEVGGVPTFIAGSGASVTTPNGTFEVDGFWNAAPLLNDHGQLLFEVFDSRPPLIRRDALLARNQVGEWHQLAGAGIEIPTVDGGHICCSVVGQFASHRSGHLAQSGRVLLAATSTQSIDVYIVSTSIPSPGLADANADSICDGRDLSVLLGSFGNPVSPPGSGADFNADGIVNGADLSILLSAFGT